MTMRSFLTTFTAMNSPFLIWAAHFGVVYGINGLACARGLEAMRIFDFPIVPLAVVVMTVVALLLTGLVLLRALRGQVRQRVPLRDEPGITTRLIQGRD
jgi:hypothetical protein